MPLRHTLLGLLHWAPMHGYLLRQHAREYSWIYPMTNANIYPATELVLVLAENAGEVAETAAPSRL